MKEISKNFRSKKSQLLYLLFLSIIICFGSFTFIDTLIRDENIIKAEILEQNLVGDAKQRGIIALQQFIISNFGKKGYLIFISLLGAFVLEEFVSVFTTYRRFKKREREIREGLRAPDDYVDDYVQVPLWRKVANLFTKKRKKKYPSEREMRDSLKKNKYYKE